MSESKQQTFGQELIGLNFNPSNLDNVSIAKQHMADVIDMLQQNMNERILAGTDTDTARRIYDMALHDILQAQMMAVKLLTLK